VLVLGLTLSVLRSGRSSGAGHEVPMLARGGTWLAQTGTPAAGTRRSGPSSCREWPGTGVGDVVGLSALRRSVVENGGEGQVMQMKNGRRARQTVHGHRSGLTRGDVSHESVFAKQETYRSSGDASETPPGYDSQHPAGDEVSSSSCRSLLTPILPTKPRVKSSAAVSMPRTKSLPNLPT
jgi:hypothetical protein